MPLETEESSLGLLDANSTNQGGTWSGITHRLRHLFRKQSHGIESRRSSLIDEVIGISDRLQRNSMAELRDLSHQLRLAAHSRTQLKSILPQAYGLVREASRRVHQQSHYEVQILAGVGLFEGGIVEMATGEGKTLSALLPAFLYALVGKGCHVVTANDYLAKRDAEFARQVFEMLGVSVGCIDESLPRENRRAEYQKDVTYGTAREFGFDFLKDRLANSQSTGSLTPFHSQGAGETPGTVQRGHYFALVDEADSVMIDDARTPLLIAEASENSAMKQQMIRWCQNQIPSLNEGQDFILSPRRRSVKLTQVGSRKVLQQCQPAWIQEFRSEEIFQQSENALVANHFFKLDRHYVIQEGEVAIVDESTGRISDGRKWQNGLHQAIEAKEKLEITVATTTMARVTVQSFFRKYQHLAGTTGYGNIGVSRVQKSLRLVSHQHSNSLAISTSGPWQTSLCEQSRQGSGDRDRHLSRLQHGQPVLIGTPSVRVSQRVSAVLEEFGMFACRAELFAA